MLAIDIEDSNDVWMVDHRRESALPLESQHDFLRAVRELRQEALDTDVDVESDMLRSVHGAHAADSDFGEENARVEHLVASDLGSVPEQRILAGVFESLVHGRSTCRDCAWCSVGPCPFSNLVESRLSSSLNSSYVRTFRLEDGPGREDHRASRRSAATLRENG